MRPVPVLLSLALTGGLACSSLPTDATRSPDNAGFFLSDAEANAFAQALQDVRVRVLPTLTGINGSASLDPLIAELNEAIGGRDPAALRSVLARTHSALAKLDRADDAALGVASELDALRLVLDQAGPLAGQGDSARR
jgi:hypothetical protein